MTEPMEPEHYVTDRERLALRLRELRAAAGLTGVQVAAASGMSQPKISKWENGKLLPSPEDMAVVLDIYRSSARDRADITELMDRLHAHIESNRTHLRRGGGHRQDQIGRIEAEATTLRFFSPIVVPGLLQTTEYMRRVFSIDLDGDPLMRAIAARQRRQQALYDTAKQFTFVVTELALRWGFTPPDVLAEQAARIVSLSALDNVRIGVIPIGATVDELPLHGYEIFDDRLVSVGLEHATVTVSDPQDIAKYVRLFRLMETSALFADDARVFLRRLHGGNALA